MIRSCRLRPAAARRAFLTASGKPFFFKSILRCNVTLGVKRTRHQLAPAVPGAADYRLCAALVSCPDRLFVGRLEIVDVQTFPRLLLPWQNAPARPFLLPSKSCSRVLRPPFGFGLSAFIPPFSYAMCARLTVLSAHAQRRRNHWLRHLALTQQNHLDALTLLRRYYSIATLFSTVAPRPLLHLTDLFPPNQMI